MRPYRADAEPVTAWLSQACVPWKASTFLRVELAEGVSVGLPQDQAAAWLAMLGALVDVAGAESSASALVQTKTFERIALPWIEQDRTMPAGLHTALLRRERELLQRQERSHVAAGDDVLTRATRERITQLDTDLQTAAGDPGTGEA